VLVLIVQTPLDERVIVPTVTDARSCVTVTVPAALLEATAPIAFGAVPVSQFDPTLQFPVPAVYTAACNDADNDRTKMGTAAKSLEDVGAFIGVIYRRLMEGLIRTWVGNYFVGV